jgi:hypothetical protein
MRRNILRLDGHLARTIPLRMLGCRGISLFSWREVDWRGICGLVHWDKKLIDMRAQTRRNLNFIEEHTYMGYRFWRRDCMALLDMLLCSLFAVSIYRWNGLLGEMLVVGWRCKDDSVVAEFFLVNFPRARPQDVLDLAHKE